MSWITSMSATRAHGGGLLLAAAVGIVSLCAPLRAAEAPSRVDVQEDHGVYTVSASFAVPEPADVAWAVLTSYEQIPRFMPGVRTSVVRERSAGRVVVEQEAVSSVMMFSKRVHLVLDIQEQPDALTFRDLCGRSFVRYEGSWRLVQRDGQTEISYTLTAQPAFDVPGFMLGRLLKRDAGRMIDSLRREVATRAAHPSSR